MCGYIYCLGVCMCGFCNSCVYVCVGFVIVGVCICVFCNLWVCVCVGF